MQRSFIEEVSLECQYSERLLLQNKLRPMIVNFDSTVVLWAISSQYISRVVFYDCRAVIRLTTVRSQSLDSNLIRLGTALNDVLGDGKYVVLSSSSSSFDAICVSDDCDDDCDVCPRLSLTL